MTFPTIPTVAAGRVLFTNQADATGTRTFPSLSSLTKNAGDLLIAIVWGYQDAGSSGAIFSSWGGGFTEFSDQMTTSGSTMCFGAAYKYSTGSETGTFTVTQASPTGHASMCLLSIPLANSITIPEAGTIANGTSSAADPGSLNPADWGTEDTLWISVIASGMTSGTGSWTATGTTAPTNYTDRADSNTSDSSTVGQTEVAVAFRQANAASEDAGTGGVDTSNARNSAVVIAVRPVVDGALAGSSTVTFSGGASVMVGDGALAGSGTITFSGGSCIMGGAGALAGSGTVSLAPVAAIGGDGALAGSGTLAFTGSGTMEAVANEALSGSSTLSFAPVAAMAAEGALAGSGTLSFAPVGAMAGTGALAGSGTVVFSNVATLAGAGALTGSSTVTFAPTGTAAGDGALAGSGLVSFAPVASLAGTGALSGLSSLSLTPQGVLLADGALAGPSVLALLASGALGAQGALAGQGVVSFSPSGAMVDASSAGLAGVAGLTFTVSGTLTPFAQAGAGAGYQRAARYSIRAPSADTARAASTDTARPRSRTSSRPASSNQRRP